MWLKTTLYCLNIILVIQLYGLDYTDGIYTNPQLSQRKVQTDQAKASISPQLYKYLKGYYQKSKGAQNVRGPYKFQQRNRGKKNYASFTKSNGPSLNTPRQYGKTYLQPKSGNLQSGQYSFAQSQNYMQKLRQLAALLKARAAQRTQQQQPQAQPRPHPQLQPQPKPRPQPQQQYQAPMPSQSYNQPQPTYNSQQTPQQAPQPTYNVQQPQAPPPSPISYQPVNTQQRTYIPPQQSQPNPAPAPAPPQTYNSNNLPRQAPRASYQSLGLPAAQTKTPSPPKPKPSIDNEALVKLLRASYASLVPLLLNQAKMTSYGVQTIPLYGSNPYKVFGPMTYGPLPKPNLPQMTLSYNPQSFSNSQSHPFSNGGYSSYTGYGSSGVQASQQTSGYSSGSSSFGGNSGANNYGGNSGGFGDGNFSPDLTCGPISDAFCNGRATGLYTHPASGHCFVQCDHVGRGHPKSCSPGTSWKELGPEPALFNYCS